MRHDTSILLSTSKMKGACLFSVHLAVWRYVTVIIVLSLWGQVVMSRETHCPVYRDIEWQKRDQQCDEGKKYHCFENENGNLESDGCYVEKLCMKGAHPVVDNNHIRCDFCRTGFQREDRLKSSTYEFSYCQRHSTPCKPEYGQSQCRAGTRELDRACTCDASLGFSPRIDGEDCDCFTPNDACSGCKFTGCPIGAIRNGKGFCEPKPIVVSTPSTSSKKPIGTTPSLRTTTRAADDSAELPDWGIALIVIFCIVAIVLVLLLWKCGVLEKCRRKFCDASSANEETPNDARQPMTAHNGAASSSANEETPNDARQPMRAHNGSTSPSAKQVKEEAAPNDAGQPVIARNGAAYTYNIEYAALDLTGIPNVTINVRKTRDVALDFGGIFGPAESYVLDPSGTSPLIHEDPSTSPRNPEARHPSSFESNTPPPVSVSSARPTAVTYSEEGARVPVTVPVLLPTDPSCSDPSVPPSSLPDPSAPPLSFLDPSAPPLSHPDPSAPPPPFLDPSAPPLSLPDPSAPPLSIPEADQSHVKEGKIAATSENSQEMWQCDEDETLRKVPHSSQHSEEDVGTPLLPSLDQGTACQEKTDPMNRKECSDIGEEGVISIRSSREGTFPQRMMSGDGIQTDENDTEVKSIAPRNHEDRALLDATELKVAAGTACTQATNDDKLDLLVNIRV